MTSFAGYLRRVRQRRQHRLWLESLALIFDRSGHVGGPWQRRVHAPAPRPRSGAQPGRHRAPSTRARSTSSSSWLGSSSGGFDRHGRAAPGSLRPESCDRPTRASRRGPLATETTSGRARCPRSGQTRRSLAGETAQPSTSRDGASGSRSHRFVLPSRRSDRDSASSPPPSSSHNRTPYIARPATRAVARSCAHLRCGHLEQLFERALRRAFHAPPRDGAWNDRARAPRQHKIQPTYQIVNRPLPEHRHPDHQPNHLLGWQSAPPHRRCPSRFKRFSDPLWVDVLPDVVELPGLCERGDRR